MEVGPQAVWLSETLLGPLLGTKSVLCKCHRYKSPSGIRLPQESDCWAEIREAPLLLRGSEGKAEAKWIPGAAYEEGPFWESQVGKGVALFGVLIFQFPGAKGILGPFSSPERPRGNSSTWPLIHLPLSRESALTREEPFGGLLLRGCQLWRRV